MAGAEMRPMSLGELLDRTFTLYRRNFLLFVGIMAVPQVIILIASLLPELIVRGGGTAKADSAAAAAFGLGALVSSLLLVIVYWSMLALSQAATVFAVSEITLGRPTSAMASYSRVRGKVWRMMDVLFSTGLRIMIGFLLFIIPGILLALRYCIAVPSAVLEDLKAREAMKRSTDLTEGRRGDAFLILLLTVVVTWIASLLFNVPVGFLVLTYAREGSSPLWVNILANLAEFLSATLVGPIGTIGMALFYYDCRVRKEAFDLQVMLSALGPGNVPVSGTTSPAQS